MTIPDWRTLTVPQLILVAGGAILLFAAVATMFSSRKNGGPGIAVWVMAPFFLAVAAGAIWLLIRVMRLIGPDF